MWADEGVKLLPEVRRCRITEEVAERGFIAKGELRRQRGPRSREVDAGLDPDQAVDLEEAPPPVAEVRTRRRRRSGRGVGAR